MTAMILSASVAARADDDDHGWKHWHRHHVPYYVVTPPRYYAPPPVVYSPPPVVVYQPPPVYYAPYAAPVYPEPVYPSPSLNINIPLR